MIPLNCVKTPPPPLLMVQILPLIKFPLIMGNVLGC